MNNRPFGINLILVLLYLYIILFLAVLLLPSKNIYFQIDIARLHGLSWVPEKIVVGMVTIILITITFFLQKMKIWSLYIILIYFVYLGVFSIRLYYYSSQPAYLSSFIFFLPTLTYLYSKKSYLNK